MSRKSKQSCDVTRREFVHASAAAAAALTLPGAPALVGGGPRTPCGSVWWAAAGVAPARRRTA